MSDDMKMTPAVRKDLVIGALIVVAVLVALSYVTRMRGVQLPSLGIDVMGDMSVPSGNGPVDTSAAVGTEIQTATSPDGKYDIAFGSAAGFAIPAASL